MNAIDFACRKLGFSASEWNTIMKAAPLPHSHYPTDWAFQKTLIRCINISAEWPQGEIELNKPGHQLLLCPTPPHLR